MRKTKVKHSYAASLTISIIRGMPIYNQLPNIHKTILGGIVSEPGYWTISLLSEDMGITKTNTTNILLQLKEIGLVHKSGGLMAMPDKVYIKPKYSTFLFDIEYDTFALIKKTGPITGDKLCRQSKHVYIETKAAVQRLVNKGFISVHGQHIATPRGIREVLHFLGRASL